MSSAISMAPLQCLFLLLLWVTANAGSSRKPIVSFDPNWATVFTKESVTLTCNVDLPEPKDHIYYWYRDNQIIPLYLGAKSVKIDYVQQEDGGSYQCQTVTSFKSEPVTLQVARSWLTLKVPVFVFEGDELYVSCAGYPGYSAREAVLYKDNEVIGSSPSDADFLVGKANMTTSGLYRCTRQVKDGVIYYSYSSEEHISVKELFSKPVMKVNPNHLTDANRMTITCDTKLSPHRETTELQFAFYRNGHNVQGFSLDNTFQVPSALLDNGGNYTCEVRTINDTVRKRSDEIIVQVAELFSKPVMKVSPNYLTETDHMTITCDTKLSPRRATTELQFVFYRDGHNVQGFSLENTFQVPSMLLEDGGNYTCEVRTINDTMRKRSDEISVQVTELFSKPVVKVNPNYLTEADHMTITCDTKLNPRRETTELQFVFYRNGHIVQGFSLENTFQAPSVILEDCGNYTCEVRTINDTVRKRSDEISVQVAELFPKPVMKVNPNRLKEADHMTITCDTELSPHRETTELQFAFYRNGHNVQGFSLDNTFQVPSVLLEDGGNYTCEVRTINDTMRKRSDEISVQVEVADFRCTVTLIKDYKEEESEVGQLPVVPPAERSFAPMGVEITMALLMFFLAVGVLVFVFKSKVALSFFNRHSCPTSSASVESSGNKKDMSCKYIAV